MNSSQQESQAIDQPPLPRSIASLQSAGGGFLQTGQSSPSRSLGSNSSTSLVMQNGYRDSNLYHNGIYMMSTNEPIPDEIAALTTRMGHARHSPEPDRKQLLQSAFYTTMVDGCAEADVSNYFKGYIQQNNHLSHQTAAVSENLPMAADWQVNRENPGRFRTSKPKPDILYGYNTRHGFKDHRVHLASLGRNMSSDGSQLVFPFLVVELKAQGPAGSQGSLWVAENQVLGAASTCTSMVSYLNDQLRSPKYIETATFSVAMSNTEARLYISWEKEKFEYYTHRYRSFALADPQHLIEFRRYVRNIIDWGYNERLDTIRHALDLFQENTVNSRAKSD
ncbi:hypothetical protein VHEMI03255 [[Torrubiella] hemipterigena]|nr:hypothetical protein VHEMI03255 [[Torrubiella] hemipterigena]